MMNRKELVYSEIIRRNRVMAADFGSKPLSILLLSNSVIANLKDYIEFDLLSNGVNAQVDIGEFDNMMQYTFDIQHKVLILFYEAWNIYPGFHTETSLKDENWYHELEERIKNELTTLFEHARHLPLIVVNSFSAHFPEEIPFASPFNRMIQNLNRFLGDVDQENLTVFDTKTVHNEISVAKSFSYKHFQLFDTLYTNVFFRTYSFYIKFIVFDVVGKTKKVLALDCDNTLWKGILGEDGSDQLQMSRENPAGKAFYEVQKMVKALAAKGVLITLCSKNNPEDVEAVLNQHPDMEIKPDEISVMKINWNNKPENLKAIASELNVGLDSIVFWDDSDFETEMVREILPQVVTFKVPDKIDEYPQFFRKQMGWFYRKHITSEDLQKTQMVKTQLRRENQRVAFSNIDEYLRSLKLEIHIETSPDCCIERISQLTQKTNQFNLSLKRYTPNEIQNLLNNPDYEIIPMRVTDQYGDYGLTGLAIIKHKDETYEVDTFLLSCRVLGRYIEFSFSDFLMDHLKKKGASIIHAPYVKTEKNAQVAPFLETMGFERKIDSEHEIVYFCSLHKYIPAHKDFIKIRQ
jgi:FkbH-like protein